MADGIVLRKAQATDDDDLRALLRNNSMNSWVNIAIEREPSFFAGEELMGPSVTVIAQQDREPHETAGMYTCSFLPVHVNGKPERVGYLAGLRVNPQYRNKLRILKNGFASIESLVGNRGTLPFWFTSVASENTRARRLLEAKLDGMPVYKPLGDMETLAISTQHGRSKGWLQQAQPDDIPAIVEFYNRYSESFQFSPVLTQAWLSGLAGNKGLKLEDFWLLKDGKDISGCMAIWDQRKFKQTVSHGYRYPLDRTYRLYNLFAGLTGRVKLPVIGHRLEQVFLSFIAFNDQAEAVALDVIREGLIKAQHQGAEAGVLGLSMTNPLLNTVKDTLPALTYRTCMETVVWPNQAEPILDGRPPQPEVAIL